MTTPTHVSVIPSDSIPNGKRTRDLGQTSAEGALPVDGPLGLDPTHREIADLIRQTEVLVCGRDAEGVQATADRLINTVVQHLDVEEAGMARIPTAGRRALLDGQRLFLERALDYARHPAPDAGADLMALLVRQADAERNVMLAEQATEDEHVIDVWAPDFVTEWALAEEAPMPTSSGPDASPNSQGA
jgi:hypothetical protein